MTLHIEQLVGDIAAMSAQATSTDRWQWLDAARALLYDYDPERLDAALKRNQQQQRPKLAPSPQEHLATRDAPMAAPSSYTVLAADGSAIPPDRNGPSRYYVLNTGLVTLCYGDAPDARISAHAELGYLPEDLYWGEGLERPVDERKLSLLMRIRELEQLAAALETVDYPAVALVDGQLVMWMLESEADEDRAWLLDRLFAAMDRFREFGVPLAGYISDSESFEMINALRIYLCPTTPATCRQCRATGPDDVQLCFHLNRFRDPSLLFDHLERGERSALVASQSSVLERYPAHHHVHYFYLHTGDEIARVEVPRWVTTEPALLELLHAVLWDQCGRCLSLPPYPPVLHEAHEAAVITTADREAVSHLIEQQLQREGRYAFRPAKSWHKRRRSV